METIEDDEIDEAFRDSEHWQVPLTEKGAELQDQRRAGFYNGWKARSIVERNAKFQEIHRSNKDEQIQT